MLQWSLITCYVASQTAEDVKNLTMTLFKTAGYSKTVRPLKNQSHVVVVQTDLVLNSIIDFNEQEENMKISGFLSIDWTDEFLQWNPEDYGGIDVLELPQNDVWRPDVALHNSFRTFSGLGSSNLLLRVHYDGLVVWSPYQILEATCDVDITYFPFDTQECPFKFSAWSYFADEVEMVEGQKGIYLYAFEENSRWSLDSTTVEPNTSADSIVIFTMTLKRKSTFYVFYILIPIVLLSFLNVLTFALPVSSGERASYNVTVFLSLAVFLTIVASEIPKNSNTISIISVYITAMIALSTATVMTSLLESRLAFRDKYTHSIGSGYMKLYRLARICQCKGDGDSRLATELGWDDVVAALDYFLFWLFFVLTFLATAVLFILAING
ncbi:neuronal acetylcholine receptor subunit alpha-5-like [Dreissena polymorpha]|uniref:Uncharacterized protein n=1 Tax=Dreissena polymorpha TaxID=45954 RepID=A0A9D4DFP7_DREPO|nr:neuronal acetylcholine receptor subunit alpha-5-like [Dreissena polymorpha]KAH3747635.1 hypothetical protein DPMN_182063 [Dreissena polymorpha]